MQPSKHASRVVNGLEEMARRLTTSIPSTPQNLPALEEGVAADEVEVVDEIMVEDVEESLDTDMIDEVMDNVELISVDIVVGIKATLLELRLLEV